MKYLACLLLICGPLSVFGFNAYDCTKMVKYSVLGPMTASSMFASSTGECSALRSERKNEKTKSFIRENDDDLKDQIAAGRGEHLDTLTELMDCSNSKKALYPKLQKEFPNLVSMDGSLIYKQLQRVYSKSRR